MATKKETGVPSKDALQRQMERTRESVSETVSEIKETLTEQVVAAKEAVGGVLDYRERFKDEPLVWSLGALSAGFALGYTMGYAHKRSKGSRDQSQVAAFADSMIDELSTFGNTLVMPALSTRIKEMFGFDMNEVLESMGRSGKKRSKPKALKAGSKTPSKNAKGSTRKTSKSRRRKSSCLRCELNLVEIELRRAADSRLRGTLYDL